MNIDNYKHDLHTHISNGHFCCCCCYWYRSHQSDAVRNEWLTYRSQATMEYIVWGCVFLQNHFCCPFNTQKKNWSFNHFPTLQKDTPWTSSARFWYETLLNQNRKTNNWLCAVECKEPRNMLNAFDWHLLVHVHSIEKLKCKLQMQMTKRKLNDIKVMRMGKMWRFFFFCCGIILATSNWHRITSTHRQYSESQFNKNK